MITQRDVHEYEIVSITRGRTRNSSQRFRYSENRRSAKKSSEIRKDGDAIHRVTTRTTRFRELPLDVLPQTRNFLTYASAIKSH